jgi:hypothetical protein
MEEMRMRKALAILATVATVGATAVTAPAQARGWGPGLAFGLAAGAITAGAFGAYGPYYGYGPGYGYYGPRYYGPRYYGSAYSAPLLAPLVTEKPGTSLPGFFMRGIGQVAEAGGETGVRKNDVSGR